jgi:primosomal protein N' (replication factor Y)
MQKKYAKIVVGLAVEGPFDYAVPADLHKEIAVGKRVWVPFRNKEIVGYCVGISSKTESRYVREIISVLDSEPLINRVFLDFLKKISGVYFATWGQMIDAALPFYLRSGRRINRERLNQNKEIISTKPVLLTPKEIPSEIRDVVTTIEKSEFKPFLIFDDYLRPQKTGLFLVSAESALSQGKDVLIIVPDLVCAEKLCAVFKENFGNAVFLYHSGMSETDKLSVWYTIQQDFPKVVIGTRVAVYYPEVSLGLIIVDDEASILHKQDESPFYNARDVALLRAQYFRTPIVLYGAPVSSESYYKAEGGKFNLVDLRRPLKSFPPVHLVDLRNSGKTGFTKTCISRPLEFKINEALSKGKKIILFLNRRGFSTLIKCFKCGWILKCRRCTQNLTYHFESKKVVCHRCGYNTGVYSLCPNCNGAYLRYQGMGTEKLESELSRIFPQARVSRLDWDIKKDKKSVQEVVEGFKDNKADILIGTDLLTKDHLDLEAGLLGVINLEQGMQFPDFRSSERLFSLILRLTRFIQHGQSGGEMVVQTFNPEDNVLLQALKKFDYSLFYKDEISARRQLGFPPFKSLVILNLRGRNKKAVENNAQQLGQLLQRKNTHKNIFVSEAIPHPVYKLRDKFRWQIFIKAKNVSSVYKMLERILKGKRRYRGSILTVDVELGGKFW